MNRPIGDEAAIAFAAAFYEAIGFGRSVKEAFELGRSTMLMKGIPEHQTPELLTRQGIDAAGLVLIAPPADGGTAKPSVGPSGPEGRTPAGRRSDRWRLGPTQ